MTPTAASAVPWKVRGERVVPDLGNHAPGRSRVRDLGYTADPVEPETYQCLTLLVVPPDRTASLNDLEGFSGHEMPVARGGYS